jgi:hypothetical protein
MNVIKSCSEKKVMKSFSLSSAEQAEVDLVVKIGNERFKSIEGIIWESQFDAGAFFEHEIET